MSKKPTIWRNIVRDNVLNVEIEYAYHDLGRDYVKGMMTITDPNLSLTAKREIRGIIGIPVKKAVQMEALIVTAKDTVDQLTPKYIYKHFLEYMKPTKIIEGGKVRDV